MNKRLFIPYHVTKYQANILLCDQNRRALALWKGPVVIADTPLEAIDLLNDKVGEFVKTDEQIQNMNWSRYSVSVQRLDSDEMPVTMLGYGYRE